VGDIKIEVIFVMINSSKLQIKIKIEKKIS